MTVIDKKDQGDSTENPDPFALFDYLFGVQRSVNA